MNWSNRIVRYGEEDPAKLVPNDKNWRLHPDAQKEVVEGALGEVGWIDEVTVNLRSGAEWPEGERNVQTVVDGHLRRDVALAAGEGKVPVKYVDLSPDEERLVLVVKDSTTGMAETDVDVLSALLESLDPDNADLRAFFDNLAEDILFLGEERPDLDDLADEYGDLADDELWPVIRIKVDPETHEMYQELMGNVSIDEEAARFKEILYAASTAA